MANRRDKRRLAAILAADIVGYSRLMGADESGTLAQLKALRKELIDPKIEEYSGRIVKTTGDGILIEFSSVVDAVQMAVDVQRETARRNEGVPEDHCIVFRVGINQGDIIVDGEDIFGDGVNIAARLEALAEPGGICISRLVRDQVRDRLDYVLDDQGEIEVKNIARPVRVFRVRTDARASTQRAIQSDKPGLAVLPFVNMSGDPEQEYFADGVTEDIITALSKVRWFFVTARNSTFAYKGQSTDVRQVARDLGVQYVLEGSVRKSGNRVRVTSQLIDATTGSHIWAEHYDRELEDIFAVQDEMTETIVAAIEPELGETERERARRKPPESLEAWDLCLRGTWHTYRFTKGDNAEAQQLFERAIELDPNFAAAHSGLAYGAFVEVMQGYSDSSADAIDRAIRAGKRAVTIDDKDPVAHWALGRAYTIKGEHDASIAELETALSLNASYAHAHTALGMVLAFAGRPEEAIRETNLAIRLSPRDPLLWVMMFNCAVAHLLMEEYEEAAAWATKAGQQPNAAIWAQAILAASLAHLDRDEEARAALEEARRTKPDFSLAFVNEVLHFKRRADGKRFLDGLRKAGLTE